MTHNILCYNETSTQEVVFMVEAMTVGCSELSTNIGFNPGGIKPNQIPFSSDCFASSLVDYGLAVFYDRG